MGRGFTDFRRYMVNGAAILQGDVTLNLVQGPWRNICLARAAGDGPWMLNQVQHDAELSIYRR
jgi:hypothetical protein